MWRVFSFQISSTLALTHPHSTPLSTGSKVTNQTPIWYSRILCLYTSPKEGPEGYLRKILVHETCRVGDYVVVHDPTLGTPDPNLGSRPEVSHLLTRFPFPGTKDSGGGVTQSYVKSVIQICTQKCLLL